MASRTEVLASVAAMPNEVKYCRREHSNNIKDLMTDDNLRFFDPYTLIHVWKKEANKKHPCTVDFATLSTCDQQGQPKSRVIRCCESEKLDRFVFVTIRDSPKMKQLKHNNRATLLFHWYPYVLTIEGPVEKLDDSLVEPWFRNFPDDDQIGLTVFPYLSKAMPSKEDTDIITQEAHANVQRDEEGKVIIPDFLVPLGLKPEMVEFHQGNEMLQSDRVRFYRKVQENKGVVEVDGKYVRSAKGNWVYTRIAG